MIYVANRIKSLTITLKCILYFLRFLYQLFLITQPCTDMRLITLELYSMIVHMAPGSNTKPSEENIDMFEAAVMVAVGNVMCNSLMSEERNIYILFK